MSTDLVPHDPRRDVLRPLSVSDQTAAMREYQQGLQSLLDDGDWQNAGRGERFVRKSGWRKIAAWFSLSLELIRDEVERDEDGNPLRATVWARAVAPNGRYADGDGHCAAEESRFRTASGRQKLENDLRGTAATRATNRAISNLVGMGKTSAEEMGDDAPAAPVVKLVEPGSPEIEHTSRALMALYGDEDEDRAQNALDAIVGDLDGQLPVMVARALQRAAQHRPRPVGPEVVDAEPVEEAEAA